VLGHKNAFFAPVSAVITLGLAPGNRSRRTVEMVIGVAVGIAVGELLISAIGTGAAQVALVVLLAMSAATLLGGGPLIASQAASSAVLVATVRTSSSGGLVPTRFVDALVGGVVGIAVLAVAPRDPSAMARRAVAPVVAELSSSLTDIASALEQRDLEAATRALERARAGDLLVARLHETLVLAQETTRIAPSHWRERGHIVRYEEAAVQLELAVRNARVIARAAVRAVDLEPRISAALPQSIRELAACVRELGEELDQGGSQEELRERILAAAVTASGALDEPRGFATDVVVGQVRSLATDLLRALGVAQPAAVDQIRAAVGERETRSSRSPAAR
jgi:uncharacterized membrane protein YgaE (UPF0421/DUF939 family)